MSSLPVRKVYTFINSSMVMAFDELGEQVPEYQGRLEDVEARIRRDFPDAEWRPPFDFAEAARDAAWTRARGSGNTIVLPPLLTPPPGFASWSEQAVEFVRGQAFDYWGDPVVVVDVLLRGGGLAQLVVQPEKGVE